MKIRILNLKLSHKKIKLGEFVFFWYHFTPQEQNFIGNNLEIFYIMLDTKFDDPTKTSSTEISAETDSTNIIYPYYKKYTKNIIETIN